MNMMDETLYLSRTNRNHTLIISYKNSFDRRQDVYILYNPVYYRNVKRL